MESDNIAGNFYNKYESLNPVAHLLMSGFHNALANQLKKIMYQVDSIVDAGCGEGYVSKRVANTTGARVCAFDVSPVIIETAKRVNSHPNVIYSVKNIFDTTELIEPADLVLCLEVLEHLEDPESALRILSYISNRYVLISVPNEPIWRILNLARGKYLNKLGNTPGHLNHWTPKQFSGMVSKYFEILNVRRPLPWTMILGRKRLPA